jgi:signal transduction histidine kinase
MTLASFIRRNTEQIVGEWEAFAQTLAPAATDMSPIALRNHIKNILDFTAIDIESPQSGPEQIQKSRGEKRSGTEPSAAETHAALRLAGGFNLDQMVSEFRALRASVGRLWVAQLTGATNLDISELIRFDEAIDQQLTESITHYTKTLDRSRSLFLGILSHDLRNPLGAARMSALLALHLGSLTERQAMLMSQIIDSADRATEIISHLLDLTRARLGSGFPVVKEPMDFDFVGRKLVDEMRAMHPDRTFALEISGDTAGNWDKPRIGQVFSNLLGNAVQYGFTGLPIVVAIKGDSEEVVLSVHNDGVPISPNVIGGIFDSLVRGEDRGKTTRSTNLGLGLYITKEIVSAHGGTICVTSSEKGGTTFTARFPR